MSLKTDIQRMIPKMIKKIKKEPDPLKRYRMRIIKQELSKLADEL